MDKHLHIVCFDVPYPADYGGAIDVFSRIKALFESGVKIHLHVFEYGRGQQSELKKYCYEVNYYKRNSMFKGFSLHLPYIVKSRANKNLLRNLLKDEYPVLLEGIHCTYFLYSNQLKNKRIFVRLHNVEHQYYSHLATNEFTFLKKIYFNIESRLLKTYEKKIANKAILLAITEKDKEVYTTLLGATKIKYLPCFVPYDSVSSKEGKGVYCLYHANLSIAENERAAIWLCENVFKEMNIAFIISGKNPSKKLANVVKQNKKISLSSNPSEQEINTLITNAQINILPSFNSSGIKIKLLHALFKGRHCIVNKATINGTELEMFCHVAETSNEVKIMVKQLMDKPFLKSEIEKRNELLKKKFYNKANAEMLMSWIY